MAAVACAVLLLWLGQAKAQPFPPTLQVSQSSVLTVFSEPITFTATVLGTAGLTPTGSVTLSDNGQQIASVPLMNIGGGQAQATFVMTLSVGNHPITVAYSGDNNFSSLAIPLPVNQVVVADSNTIVNSTSPNPNPLGQATTFVAAVTPKGPATATPTGTVTFSVNGGPGTTVPLSGNQATFTSSTLPGGTDTITATYNGDGNFHGSSGSTTETITPAGTSTTVTSSLNPSAFGQSVTFTATVTGGAGGFTPTGTVTFSVDGGFVTTVNLVSGQANFLTAALTAGSHTITAVYNSDRNFTASSGSVTQGVNQNTTTTSLTSSHNPSSPGQAVTFTATVHPASGSGTPTGIVTFKDGSTTLGTGTVTATGRATFTIATLALGTHPITAVYGGDGNFTGSTSPVLVQNVNATLDSTKLRELQISATPIIAQGWAQAVTAAMADATGTGLGGNPQSLSPNGTGFTYYFNDDPPAQPISEADADSLNRFLASPDGGGGSAGTKRGDDSFGALGYAPMPTKAPPPVSTGAPREWLAWISVRGTDFYRGTVGSDLKGEQVDAFAGLTRRFSPNFVVGAFGGYEHFDYSSQAFNGVLKGDGWTAGAYLGWKLAPNLRFDAGGAWSDLLANGVSGTARGSFLGTRWLVQGGLTGTYPWQMLVLEPSARVFALWEHENAYTDSLGTLQPARSFETGRASAGLKAIYPLAWTSSTVALSPYAGLYADYYFSRDDAQTAGLTTVPLLQGFSARLTGGVTASFTGGASLGAGGEFGGIGSQNHIWTWTARGRIPF